MRFKYRISLHVVRITATLAGQPQGWPDFVLTGSHPRQRHHLERENSCGVNKQYEKVIL